MSTPKQPQLLVVKALHAQTEPVYPGRHKLRHPTRVDVTRVRLERNLGRTHHPKSLPAGPQHPPNLLRIEQTRRPPTKIDAVNLNSRLPPNLHHQRLDVRRNQLKPMRLPIEITIRANRPTPWDVYVYAY